jgi:hypothetical protein
MTLAGHSGLGVGRRQGDLMAQASAVQALGLFLPQGGSAGAFLGDLHVAADRVGADHIGVRLTLGEWNGDVLVLIIGGLPKKEPDHWQRRLLRPRRQRPRHCTPDSRDELPPPIIESPRPPWPAEFPGW